MSPLIALYRPMMVTHSYTCTPCHPTLFQASLELIRRLQEEKASEHMARVHEARLLHERVSHDEDILRAVTEALQGQQMEMARLAKQLHVRLGYEAASVAEQVSWGMRLPVLRCR